MSATRRRPATGSPTIEVEPLRYRAGDVIAEKYRLDELLGEGGMGTVWRARNLALDVDVALKLVHGDLLSAETTTRLRQEAHAAARLEHPSAVRVFDLGETPLGDSFIVMELLRGRSLREHLDESGPIPATRAVALLLPVASALVAAHAKGIVHRDLKPDNVMLVDGEDDTVVPKVVDFGIAKVDGPAFRENATAAGSILGSPEYMSPEQARGDVERIDARSDVWSFGVLLFETIAGRPPFEASHPLAVLRAVIEDEPPTLSSRGLGDEEISAILARALSKDPAGRWPDMRSLGRALAEWAMTREVVTDVTGVALAAQWVRSPASGAHAIAPDTTNPFLRRPSLEALRRAAEQGAVPAAPRRSRARSIAVGLGAVAIGAVGAGLALRAARPAAPAPTALTPVASPGAGDPAASAEPAAATRPGGPPPADAAAGATAAPGVPATAPATGADRAACLAALFPDGSFDDPAPLVGVCGERDPRRAAALLRSQIARAGMDARAPTEAMRTWALLSWYELAAVGFAQGACCGPDRATADLPPSIGACPDLGAAVDAIARVAASGGDLDAATAQFRAAAGCVERGFRANPAMRSPYSYAGPPGGGAETAFRKIARPRP